MPVVYVLTNEINKKQYVGISKTTAEKRWRRHLQDSKSKNQRLYKAIREYGAENFTLETIYEGVNWQEVCAVERGIIAERGTFGMNGYNSTCGGDGAIGAFRSVECRALIAATLKGHTVSEETRRLLSKKNRGYKHSDAAKAKILSALIERMALQENRDRVGDFFRGKPLARAHKEKLSAAQTGKSRSDETRAKISKLKTGLTHSQESISKISAKLMGHPVSPETRAKISATKISKRALRDGAL